MSPMEFLCHKQSHSPGQTLNKDLSDMTLCLRRDLAEAFELLSKMIVQDRCLQMHNHTICCSCRPGHAFMQKIKCISYKGSQGLKIISSD